MKASKHDKWRKSFPYYKVQWWDKVTRAWRDIQHSFPDTDSATAYARTQLNKPHWRIMEVQRKGRRPIIV